MTDPSRYFVAAIGGSFNWPEHPVRLQFGGDDFELRPATASTPPNIVLVVVPDSNRAKETLILP